MTAISKVKETLATLKGAEATLRMYSLQERNKKSRTIYNQTSEEIRKINTDLELWSLKNPNTKATSEVAYEFLVNNII